MTMYWSLQGEVMSLRLYSNPGLSSASFDDKTLNLSFFPQRGAAGSCRVRARHPHPAPNMSWVPAPPLSLYHHNVRWKDGCNICAYSKFAWSVCGRHLHTSWIMNCLSAVCEAAEQRRTDTLLPESGRSREGSVWRKLQFDQPPGVLSIAEAFIWPQSSTERWTEAQTWTKRRPSPIRSTASQPRIPR